METLRFDCDCDRVIEMEQMRIGVEEILQYSRAILPRDDLLLLIRGLEAIASATAEVPAAEAR
jgi:hypothetical protein